MSKPKRSNYVPWKGRLEESNCIVITTQGFKPIEPWVYGSFDYTEYDILKRVDARGYTIYIEPCSRRNGAWRVTHCHPAVMDTKTFDLTEDYAQYLLLQANNITLFNKFTPELVY